MEHVRWLAQPSLQRPILIAAFTGWNDAADAASNSVRHLVEAWQAQPLAEIDPEEFTDFATVRPHVRLTPEQRRTIVWPTVGAWSASTPGGDVILVLGPEPALRWRLFTQQLIGIAQQFDVSMVLTLGALLADVPHSRPVQLIGTATEQDTIDRFDLQRSRYEGPTGIVGVVQDACTRRPVVCIAVGCGTRLRAAGAFTEGIAGAGRASVRDHRHPRPHVACTPTPSPTTLACRRSLPTMPISSATSSASNRCPTAASSTTTTSTRMTTTTMTTRSAVSWQRSRR